MNNIPIIGKLYKLREAIMAYASDTQHTSILYKGSTILVLADVKPNFSEKPSIPFMMVSNVSWPKSDNLLFTGNVFKLKVLLLSNQKIYYTKVTEIEYYDLIYEEIN